MKELLQKTVFGNSIETYIVVALSIAVALLVKRFVSRYLAILLYKIFSKAGRTFHKTYFLDLVVGPLEWFLALFMIVVALDKLHLPFFLDFNIYRADSRDIIDAITNATLIILFIRLCIRVVQFFGMILEEKARESREQADSQLVVFFKDFFRVILILAGILLILRFSFHYNVSNLLTGLSIVGAAIALATKESLENLIASFIIFFDKPFTTGDTVKVNGFTGAVEKIGLRSTRIRTDQKTFITVPNKQMVDTILDNISLRSQRKVELRVEVSLSATTTQLRETTAAIRLLLKQDDVISASVFVSDTGKNAHVITVDYFTAMSQSAEEFNLFREKINFAVIDLLAQKEIALAASSADVVIHQAQP